MVMTVRVAPPLPLIFLLMIYGDSSAGWNVSYRDPHICALKDSSVIMSCTYTYPTRHQIMKVFWTKKPQIMGKDPPDLFEDPGYSQRLQYLGDKQQNCTIRLSHVTQKDEHMYYFRFRTNIDNWIGKPGVNLTVTDLQVESPERVKEEDSVRLTCKSSCTLTDGATFIWYRNSQQLTERRDRNNELLLQSVRREDAGIYSCAVHGHTYISPPIYLNVTYPPKYVSVSVSPSEEIMEGDSVTLICNSDSNPPAWNFSWFKGERFIRYGKIYKISNISSEHRGEYRCSSRNQDGEKYSDAVTLFVICEFYWTYLNIFRSLSGFGCGRAVGVGVAVAVGVPGAVLFVGVSGCIYLYKRKRRRPSLRREPALAQEMLCHIDGPHIYEDENRYSKFNETLPQNDGPNIYENENQYSTLNTLHHNDEPNIYENENLYIIFNDR